MRMCKYSSLLAGLEETVGLRVGLGVSVRGENGGIKSELHSDHFQVKSMALIVMVGFFWGGIIIIFFLFFLACEDQLDISLEMRLKCRLKRVRRNEKEEEREWGKGQRKKKGERNSEHWGWKSRKHWQCLCWHPADSLETKHKHRADLITS